MAFQIIDDLLDWIGDENSTGKKRFQDIRDGRVTLPLMLLMEKIPENKQKEITHSVESRSPLDDIFLNSLSRQMDELKISERIRNTASKMVSSAVSAIDEIPKGNAKDHLTDLAYAIVNRSF